MTLQKLRKLEDSKKSQVIKEFNKKGYFENMGMKQLCELEDAAMKLAHDHTANWDDRQKAQWVVISFNNWIDNL